MYRKEPHNKSKTILQVAKLWKICESLVSISEAIGVPVSTLCGWLLRLQEGSLRCRHDYRPGRPCRLSGKQESLREDLYKSLKESGSLRSMWVARLVAYHTKSKFA